LTLPPLVVVFFTSWTRALGFAGTGVSETSRWQGTSDELKEKYPGDAEMQAFMRMRIERGVLSWVTWLLAGKTPDEIRAMEDPPTLDLPDPP
jgi:hypothetical protein